MQLRRPVRRDVDHEGRGQLASCAHPGPRVAAHRSGWRPRKGGERGDRPVRGHAQRDDRLLGVLGDELGRGDRLVQLEREVQLRAFDGTHPPGVFNPLGREVGVSGISQHGIRPLQPGMLEDAHLVFRRGAAPVLQMVGQVLVRFGHAPAEDRIGQALDERDRLRRGAGGAHDHRDAGRQAAAEEAGEDDQALAPLEACVARRHDDAASRHPRRRAAALGRAQDPERGDQPSQRGQLRALGQAHARARDHPAPVALAAVGQSLIEQAAVEIAGGAAGGRLLHGGEEQSVELGVLLFDLLGERPVIGLGGALAQDQGGRRRAGERGEHRQGQGRGPAQLCLRASIQPAAASAATDQQAASCQPSATEHSAAWVDGFQARFEEPFHLTSASLRPRP